MKCFIQERPCFCDGTGDNGVCLTGCLSFEDRLHCQCAPMTRWLAVFASKESMLQCCQAIWMGVQAFTYPEEVLGSNPTFQQQYVCVCLCLSMCVYVRCVCVCVCVCIGGWVLSIERR